MHVRLIKQIPCKYSDWKTRVDILAIKLQFQLRACCVSYSFENHWDQYTREDYVGCIRSREASESAIWLCLYIC